MTVHSWLLYLIFVAIATSTPGPAVLFITTKSLLHGWRKSTFAALGNIAGLLCLGILAVTGLGAVLKSSEALFSCIKYAGAAYLVFLGIKLIIQKNLEPGTITSQNGLTDISSRSLFFQAFTVAVSNPKAIVFLTALFPQFIRVEHPLPVQFITLISTLMISSFVFLMCYAFLASRAKSWLSNPERVSTVNRTSGSLFVGFGILLAMSSER